MIDISKIDSCSDVELRAMLKALIASQQTSQDPYGVDAFSHLPIFLDKPECPRCLPFTELKWDPATKTHHPLCHDCGEMIPNSIEFQNRGIESVTVDHLHSHTIVPGAPGSTGVRFGPPPQTRIPARRELCLPCFRIDWAKANPDKPCDL